MLVTSTFFLSVFLFSFSSFTVGPVMLPSEENTDEPFVGDTATVSGWGTTRQGGGGSVSDVLLAVDVPVLSDQGE